MSEKIEPALTAEQWAEVQAIRAHRGRVDDSEYISQAALMALANERMPDDDPRKITRERLRAIKTVAYAQKLDGHNDLEAEENIAYAFADALESLLPPAAG